MQTIILPQIEYLKERNCLRDKFLRFLRIFAKFAKLSPCEKSTGSQFAKLNPREKKKQTNKKQTKKTNVFQN